MLCENLVLNSSPVSVRSCESTELKPSGFAKIVLHSSTSKVRPEWECGIASDIKTESPMNLSLIQSRLQDLQTWFHEDTSALESAPAKAAQQTLSHLKLLL